MKLTPTLLLLIILSGSLFSQSTSDCRRFSFGANIAYANQNLSGFNRFVETWTGRVPPNVEPVHGGFQYSAFADYKFFSSTYMLTGLEFSYSDINSEFSSAFVHLGNDGVINHRAEIQTVSVFLNLGCGLSLSEKLDLNLKTGVGYIHTSFIRENKSPTDESFNGKVTDKGKAFGSRMGLNASYRIIDFVVLSSGIAYNSAWINSFKDNSGKESWVGDNKDGARKLEVDLSGFQFHFGLGIVI